VEVGLADLPEGFALKTRDGVAWLEYVLGGHRAIFSLKGLPGDPEIDGPLDLGRTLVAPNRQQILGRRKLYRAVGIDELDVRLVRQVHGHRILALGDLDSVSAGAATGASTPDLEADGFFLPVDQGLDLVPAIVTADCLPVVISGPIGIALLHLGWRGLASPMSERAVEMTGGGEALIGPGIGPCCYEVGDEVFEALGLDRTGSAGSLDLASIATARLVAAGIGKVVSVDLCTSCEQDLFFSHRREGEPAGRQMSMVAPVSGVGI
jgi:copper oxidase (laccase) domain-containing protein